MRSRALSEKAELEVYLNEERLRLLALGAEIIGVWPDARGLLDVLASYSGGFRVRPLPDASMAVADHQREIWLSEDRLKAISDTAAGFRNRGNWVLPPGDEESTAVTIGEAYLSFALHEVYHITQGIGDFCHAQRVKAVAGAKAIGRLDLESSFVAAKVIALASAQEQKAGDESKVFLESYVRVWAEAGGIKHVAFPVNRNIGKIHRFLGYLVMCYFAADAWERAMRLPYTSSLWPEWSEFGDELLLFDKNGRLWSPPIRTEPETVQEVLAAIAAGDVERGLKGMPALLRGRLGQGRLTLLGTGRVI